MPEDWRDDYAKKIARQKMRRIAEIGAYLAYPDAQIIKTISGDITTYHVNIIVSEPKSTRTLIFDQSEIRMFLTYTTDETAKTKLMAYILGQHD